MLIESFHSIKYIDINFSTSLDDYTCYLSKFLFSEFELYAYEKCHKISDIVKEWILEVV